VPWVIIAIRDLGGRGLPGLAEDRDLHGRLFVIEIVGAVLILIVGIVVFAKGGYGGNHFGFTQYFSFKGVSVSSVFLGIVIAFLGFGGFEGAAVVSAFSATVGNANAATRYLFALGRDGFLSRRLAETQHTQRSPIAALAVLSVPALILSIAFAGTSPANAFNYVGGAACTQPR
jgi:amino acid transporter